MREMFKDYSFVPRRENDEVNKGRVGGDGKKRELWRSLAKGRSSRLLSSQVACT